MTFEYVYRAVRAEEMPRKVHNREFYPSNLQSVLDSLGVPRADPYVHDKGPYYPFWEDLPFERSIPSYERSFYPARIYKLLQAIGVKPAD